MMYVNESTHQGTNTWLKGKTRKEIYLIFTLEERNVFLAIFFYKKKTLLNIDWNV